MGGSFGLRAAGVALAFLAVAGPALAEDSAKAAMARDALRLLKQHEATAPAVAEPSFLAPTPPQTVGEAELERVAAGARLDGVQVRDDPGRGPELDPYFEGSFRPVRHAYLQRNLAGYDAGVYAVPGEAAYVGTFSYFGQPTEDWDPFPKGSFVVVGKKLTPDGSAETGIWIAERAIAGFSLNLLKATPDYLAQFERRHAAAVQAYERQLAEEASGGLDFGAVLALGFGAALIGSSDLPGPDKLQLGQAFLGDVTGQGDGQALLGILASGSGGGGSGLFTGGRSFQAPGLNELIAGAVAGQGPVADGGFGAALGTVLQAVGEVQSGGTGVSPQAAGPALPAMQPQAAQPASSETFSFTCPAGDSHAMPVSYRDPGCGAAMKNFARVYACNLIGDFAAAGQRCQQACGHPQCAEVR